MEYPKGTRLAQVYITGYLNWIDAKHQLYGRKLEERTIALRL